MPEPPNLQAHIASSQQSPTTSVAVASSGRWASWFTARAWLDASSNENSQPPALQPGAASSSEPLRTIYEAYELDPSDSSGSVSC